MAKGREGRAASREAGRGRPSSLSWGSTGEREGGSSLVHVGYNLFQSIYDKPSVAGVLLQKVLRLSKKSHLLKKIVCVLTMSKLH